MMDHVIGYRQDDEMFCVPCAKKNPEFIRLVKDYYVNDGYGDEEWKEDYDANGIAEWVNPIFETDLCLEWDWVCDTCHRTIKKAEWDYEDYNTRTNR